MTVNPFDTYLQSFIGVGVSVLLFLVGYRQTVGAKRERVRAANTEIEKTLLRRIVLEAYKPATNDLIRLIEGKARDYRVRAIDLLTVTQLLNTLFTRVVESDFVTPDQREKILERISPLLASLEEKPPEIELVEEDTSSNAKRYRARIQYLMAVVTSLAGTLMTLYLFKPDQSLKAYTPIFFLIFGISIVAITAFILIQRFKESQEESVTPSVVETGFHFERDVAKMLAQLRVPWSSPGPSRDNGYDFVLDLKGRRVIVEIKAWTGRPPLVFLRRVAARLQDALKTSRADEAIIVTKGDVWLPEGYFGTENIKVMSLKSFRNYISHLR